MTEVAPTDVWARLRASTPARIGLGRSGDAVPTSALIELRAAHAQARDAVHTPLDVAVLRAGLASGAAADLPVAEVASAAADRSTYLRRPDLGRRLAAGAAAELADHARASGAWDVVFVLADGLSAQAVSTWAPRVLADLLPRLSGWAIGPLVVAQQARVALGDEVALAVGARSVVVLVGERPGLSAADSLGAYITWQPHVGCTDAERNCLSNIRTPYGQSPEQAGAALAALLARARAAGVTGVALKADDAGALTGG